MTEQGQRDFIKNTLKDYNKSVRVKKYVKNIPITEDRPHNDYDQIGVRYRLEEDIFDPNSDIYPGIIGLTDVIKLGEQAYFVRKLIDDGRITSRYEIERSKFTPKYFYGLIGNWDAAALFPVDIFYEDLHMIKQKNKKWLKYISYPDRDARFYSIYPLYPVSQKLIKEIDHVIIVYNRIHTRWYFVEFNYEFLDEAQRLKIDIGNLEQGHRIVTLKTVNKFDYLPENVKIINIIE